jgi:hypothetical protein
VTAENGRRFIPNTVVFKWVWSRRQGWTWSRVDVSGLLVADDGHLRVPDLRQRVSFRAVPADAPPGDGQELPNELVSLMDVPAPAEPLRPPKASAENRGFVEDVFDILPGKKPDTRQSAAGPVLVPGQHGMNPCPLRRLHTRSNRWRRGPVRSAWWRPG